MATRSCAAGAPSPSTPRGAGEQAEGAQDAERAEVLVVVLDMLDVLRKAVSARSTSRAFSM